MSGAVTEFFARRFGLLLARRGWFGVVFYEFGGLGFAFFALGELDCEIGESVGVGGEGDVVHGEEDDCGGCACSFVAVDEGVVHYEVE